MKNELTQSLARDLARIEEFLCTNVSSLSPELGFAAFVYDKANHRPPFSLAAGNFAADLKRLDQAPILAAAGFFSAIKSAAIEKPSAEAWAAAFLRLSKRDPFPADRASFCYRPLEVVGIALGIAHIQGIDAASKLWLNNVLNRLLEQEPANFWSKLLYSVAGKLAGLPITSEPVSRVDRLSLPELALLRWAASTADFKSIAALAQGVEAELDRSILAAALKTTPVPRDLAEAALVHCSLDGAIAARLDSALAETWQVGQASKDAVAIVTNICRRFPLFVKPLSERHNKRPAFSVKDEYDVQDLLQALLKLHFDDVRPEEVAPSYAGNSSRMDFLLKTEKVVVEAKMTRKNLGQKEVASQLIEDIARYRTHPDCQTLICFVYDPAGHCTNPVALESDVSKTDGSLKVHVIVSPHGL